MDLHRHRGRRTVAVVLGVATAVLAASPVSAVEAQTTLDVLSVVDGRPVVESVTVPTRRAASTEAGLAQDPAVLAVDAQVTYEVVAPDPYWDEQDPVGAAHARQAWDVTRGAGQIVAVLDDGVDPDHEDLAGALLPLEDVVGGPGDASHGTAVAGVVAARADNGLGGAGIAPEARVLPVRVCDATGCPSSAVAQGILHAVDHGADVINLSLAGPGYSAVTAAAVLYATDRGISVVASAGNDGLLGNPVMYPAANSGVIAVGALTSQSTPVDWSVHGWQVDISTVGEDVLVPMPGDGYGHGSGTSFSGPAVAGAVALLRASHPGIGVEAIQAALQASADSSGDWDRDYGAGRLDIPAALAAAGRTDGGVRVTGDRGTLHVSWDAVPGASTYAVRLDGVLRTEVAGTQVTLTGLTDGDQVAVDVQPDNGARSQARLGHVGVAPPGVVTLHDGEMVPNTSSPVLGLLASTDVPGETYSVVRNGVSVGSVPLDLSSTPTWVHLSGGWPDESAVWQLRAVDGLGRTSAASNPLRVGEGTPPAPVGITGLAASVDGDRLLLTWDQLAQDAEYVVESGGAVVQTARSGGAVVAAPPVGTAGTYSVHAVDLWGQSGPGATVEIVRGDTLVGLPGAPTSVVATRGTSASAVVSWTAPADDGGSPVTGYTVTASPGGRTVTATGSARSATVEGLDPGVPYTFTVTATNALGTSAPSGPSTAVTPSAPVPVAAAPDLVTLAPVRVRDVSDVPASVVRCVQVAGQHGIPADATGLTLNVTAAQPSGPGHAVVFPDTRGDGTTPAPGTSTVNYEPGRDVANATFVALPASGRLCYLSRGPSAVRLVLDVTGYTAPGSTFALGTPTRVLDTRQTSAVTPRTVRTAQITGRAGVPATATAAVVNVTVTGATGPGHLRMFPHGAALPDTSVINYVPGTDKANSTVVALSADGRLDYYSDSTGPVQVVLDVVGYVDAGGGYTGIVPTRLVDTRPGSGIGTLAGRLSAGRVYSVDPRRGAVPADATAVVLSVTAIGPTGVGHLRVYPGPSGSPAPDISTVNYVPGRAIPNMVVLDLAPETGINMTSVGAATDVAVDVVGYIRPRG